jgi:hypothetical protein
MELIEEFENISNKFMIDNGYSKINCPKSDQADEDEICFSNGKTEIKVSRLGWDNYFNFFAEINGQKIRTIDLVQFVDSRAAAIDILKSIEKIIKPAANNGEHS